MVIATVTAIGLVATTTASVYAALWLAAPQLKPREKLGGQLDNIAIESGASYLTYWTDDGQTSVDENTADLKRKGVYVFVHATLLGYKERTYSVNPILIDEHTNKRIIPYNQLTNGLNAVCDQAIPSADEDGLVWRCWMIAPPKGTLFRVRVELKDSGRTAEIEPGFAGHRPILDFIESEPIIYR